MEMISNPVIIMLICRGAESNISNEAVELDVSNYLIDTLNENIYGQ